MLPIELRRVPLFTAMTRADLAVIAATMRSTHFPHGARLFRTGDICIEVTVVRDGYVRLFRRTADGAEITTGIVRPGCLVAVASLRNGTTHDSDAEAIGRVRTIEVPAATLLGLMGRSPYLFAEVAGCLATRISDAYVDAVTDAQEQLSSRILHTLRRLALPGPGERQAKEIRPLAVRLSHAELARLVGADRVTVTRTLGRLEEQGLIGRKHGHITGVMLTTSVAGWAEWDGFRLTLA